MNHNAHYYDSVVTWTVVAVFGLLAVVTVAWNDPPEFTEQYVQLAIVWTIVTALWVFAARLLWRAWWARYAAGLSALDWPARLLSAAVATLPDDRREWGAAMVAELDQVSGRTSRWQFAAGCAWTALFPPRSSHVPMLAVAGLALVTVVASGSAVELIMPSMRAFAVSFTACFGALMTLVAARPWMLRQLATAPVRAAAGAGGVVACIVATTLFLARNPAAAEHFPSVLASFFAVLLAGCTWLAVLPPRGLATDRYAQRTGLVTALLFAVGLFVTSRWTINTLGGTLIWTLLAPPAVFAAASSFAAFRRSFRTGVQAAIWTALFGALLVFALSLPEAMRRHALDGRTLGDGEAGYAIGVNLADAVWIFVVLPMWGLPFGVLGAALGRAMHSRHPADDGARQSDDPALPPQ